MAGVPDRDEEAIERIDLLDIDRDRSCEAGLAERVDDRRCPAELLRLVEELDAGGERGVVDQRRVGDDRVEIGDVGVVPARLSGGGGRRP